MFKANGVWKWKVLVAKHHDYSHCEDGVSWMCDPDFVNAEVVYEATPDIADGFVFDTEAEALNYVIEFYSKRRAS